jgi:hypothetical protein
MDVAQGLDPSLEGPKDNLASDEELIWNPRCMIHKYLCSITSMLGR